MKLQEKSMISQDVFVFCENAHGSISLASKEILSKAKHLANQLSVKLVALSTESFSENNIKQIQQYGVDEIIICDVGNKAYNYEFVAKAIIHAIEIFKPQILLFCSNYRGRALAPWIASKMKTGATADCINLSIDPITKKLIQTRPAYSGNLMADIVCENTTPQIATVRCGVFPQITSSNLYKRPNIISINCKQQYTSNIELISRCKITEENSLYDAEIILAGGRGIGKEGFILLDKLSKVMGNCVYVAGTRVAVDLGFIDYSKQIGQTGLNVNPKLYCAFGISGASEHIVGITNSDKILAVNTDPKAKIFDVADYKIVGDAIGFISRLIDKYNIIKEK